MVVKISPQVGIKKYGTHTLICLMAPYLPKMSYISSAVILYGRFLIYNILLTSGGSRT